LLRQHSIAAWYSGDDIASASVWERTIRQGLASCDWFLVVLSPDAIRSEWVQAEVQWAMDHRKERIVPVLARACDPSDLHLQLIRYQYVDFANGGDEARAKLLAVWGVATGHLLCVEVDVLVRSLSEAATDERKQTLVIRELATIGKASNCELCLKGPTVSRQHAALRIRETDGKKSVWLFNFGTNGTRVNGAEIQSQPIRPGDVISVGDFEIEILGVRNCAA